MNPSRKPRRHRLACSAAGLALAWGGIAQAQDAPGGGPYFGYALADCGYHDPRDNDRKTNYVAEFAAFSNLAQLCVFDAGDRIAPRLELLSRHQVKAMLSVQAIFFAGQPDAHAGSGTKFSLRADYRSRWSTFVETNELARHQSSIAAFYLADEPGWNGISPRELALAAQTVKASFPQLPTAIVEAPPALALLEIPTAIDWVGIDHYGLRHPDTDPLFRQELALLKSKRSRAGQRVLLVMDAQWLPGYGFAPAEMGAVASAYHRLLESDTDVVGLVGYSWPGGFGDPRQQGARELPANVLIEHQRIGKLLTGK